MGTVHGAVVQVQQVGAAQLGQQGGGRVRPTARKVAPKHGKPRRHS
ncbi:hypothetical protein P2Q00_20315 [Streptomyces coacervatus]|nr:hypothetical protein [Streptomyces coacervatus]MDF2267763.1 hypothetical protein [Streptomyces coacervatus]